MVKVCNRNLFVVTGISGSGKTTVAHIVGKMINCEIMLSLDDYKVSVYEKYGFLNDTERKILWDCAKTQFQADIISGLRQGKNIIIDYPFDISWQDFFEYCSTRYHYNLVIINCNTRNFDDIWESRIERDFSNSRHDSLTASKYIKGKIYVRNSKKYDCKKREQKQYEYKTGKYTSLLGDYEFTDIQIIELLRHGEEKVYECFKK